jgi:DNA-binding NarL/FixJ family response regulator
VKAGLSEADQKDAQQEVSTALLYMSNPPVDDEGCKKAAHTIVRRHLASRYRKLVKQREVIAGPVEHEDHARGDAREQATGRYAQRRAVLREALADGSVSERDLEIMDLKGQGYTDREIAKLTGIAAPTVANRATRTRKALEAKWKLRVAGLVGLMAAGALLFALSRRRPEEARVPHPQVPPSAVPTASQEIPVAVRAAQLREEAASACSVFDYATCFDRLERAAALDPAGESQESVRELRHQLEDGARRERFPDSKFVGPR